MDPHIMAGLATLIVLELVLGIDNLVFIAILANKLPPAQRDTARIAGLTMAMAIRLALLAVMSHIVALTAPVLTVAGRDLSWRDLILICGGVFLLFKATTEIHERLEGHRDSGNGERRVPSFWITIVQIVVLDAIFSLDSIITAVGMVDDLWVMMAAVMISMAIMITASKPLTAFVSRHPTVIILCLSFLLLIGCSLIADGLGFHFPKSYLYAAIGFSLLIEGINQVGGHKRRRAILSMPLRDRTSNAILRLLSPLSPEGSDAGRDEATPTPMEAGGLRSDETRMIRGVISLSTLQVRSIMTLRPEVVWVDCNVGDQKVVDQLVESGRTRVLLCDSSIDRTIGVIEVRDALRQALAKEPTDLRALARKPLYVRRNRTVTDLIDDLRKAEDRFAVALDEDGNVEGVVTTTDIFAAIAGDLADDEDDDLIEERSDGSIVVDGMARMGDVEAVLDVVLGPAPREYETVSGHVLHIAHKLPEQGESFVDAGYEFTVDAVDGRKIERVVITPVGESA
jgi:CBS domain containing-hemolysin-like protein